MTAAQPIQALFVDVGGVLLTNGWDRRMRREAAKTFNLDYAEMDERHHLTFGTYEEGKITLDEYLNRVVFYESRSFSSKEFREFMFRQSQPFADMIRLLQEVKKRWGLKIVVVSNEGRELTEYRIAKFELSSFIDAFVCSCFVRTRKPDTEMYRIALDLVQVPAGKILYIEDRSMFVEIARNMGIQGILHADYKSTRAALEARGLSA